MASSIVPINYTRDFSVKPAEGLRYGNFENIVHLPPLVHGHLKDFCTLNNQQIYKKVCDWYTAWRPWQQCVLLCGIADRCTIRQLDMLSTSLEPLKHRDFTAAFRMRYPTSPFKKLRIKSESLSILSKKNSQEESSSDEEFSDILTDDTLDYYKRSPVRLMLPESPSIGFTEYSPSTSPCSTPESLPKEVFKKYNKLEVVHEHAVFSDHVKEPSFVIDHYADKLSLSILDNVMKNISGSEREAEDGVDDTGKSVSKKSDYRPVSYRSGKTAKSKSSRPKSEVTVKSVKSTHSRVKSEKLSEKSTKMKSEKSTRIKSEKFSEKSLKSKSEKGTRMKSEKLSEKTFKTTTHKSDKSISFGKNIPPIKKSKGRPHSEFPTSTLGPQESENLQFERSLSQVTRSISQFSHRSVGYVRHKMFGRTAISTPDFFSERGTDKTGPMQREIRFNQIQRPLSFQDLPISLQKLYKGNKWWPQEPSEGRKFVKASRNDLLINYKKQLQEVYNWMSQWEDYEKINLLSEILKCSGPDALNFLMNYIQQKLRDARDINRLSDKLLLYIFSFLIPRDIGATAQVCKRWRYLCATDQLWMIKCHELGVKEGIQNMESIVIQARKNRFGVDWQLAYAQLQRIVEAMKLAKEKELAEAEAEKKRAKEEANYSESFVTLLESTSPLLDIPDSLDLLQRYRTMFHLSPLTVSEESDGDESEPREVTPEIVEIQVKRGHISKLKPAHEKRLLRTMRNVKEGYFSDSDSSASSEDLSQYRDFVFQSTEDTPYDFRLDDVDDVKRRQKPIFHWKRAQGSFVKQEQEPMEHLKSKEELQKEIEQRIKEDEERFKMRRINTDIKFVKSKVKTTPPRPKKKKPIVETAYDIRTELVQAQDLLGKASPSMHLEWKNEDDKLSSNSSPSLGRYMGVVKSVRRVRKLQGHMNGVLCIQHDKRRLISAGLDRTIRIWDIRSGKSIHKFYGHKGGIRCLVLEDNTLVTGSWDTTIIVWDLRTFEKRAFLTEHSGCISCLAMNHEYLVSGSHDMTVRVWYRTIMQQYKVIKGHKGPINCIAFDGDFVVSGANDMTLRMVNIHTEELVHVFVGSEDSILSVAVQGDLIVSGDQQGRVFFWNKETGKAEAAIQAHNEPINKIIYYKGRFTTASGDCTIREWDLMTMTSVRLLQGHQGPVRDVKVTSDRIVSCGDDGTIRIWDLHDSSSHKGGIFMETC